MKRTPRKVKKAIFWNHRSGVPRDTPRRKRMWQRFSRFRDWHVSPGFVRVYGVASPEAQ